MRFFLLIVKNLRQNKFRSILTALAVFVLVVIFSLIATVLRVLDQAMEQKATDVPLVITERYRFPSRFDRRHLEQIIYPGSALNDELSQVAGFHPEKHTLWHFVVLTLDPALKDKSLQFFVIATLPEKIPTMIDGMDGLDPQVCERMKKPPRSQLDNAGLLMGRDRLAKLNKKVGDVFKARSISHREGTGARRPIELEFEIVGEVPTSSRWAPGAFMDYAYLDRVLKDKQSELDGKINLAWLKVDDQDSANRVSGVIERSIADIKCETAATSASRFLASYKNAFHGVKFLLAPAIVVAMVVIVANAVGITVRERQTEMAVLKVLGFRPSQIVLLVLGEGLVLALQRGFKLGIYAAASCGSGRLARSAAGGSGWPLRPAWSPTSHAAAGTRLHSAR